MYWNSQIGVGHKLATWYFCRTGVYIFCSPPTIYNTIVHICFGHKWHSRECIGPPVRCWTQIAGGRYRVAWRKSSLVQLLKQCIFLNKPITTPICTIAPSVLVTNSILENVQDLYRSVGYKLLNLYCCRTIKSNTSLVQLVKQCILIKI